MSEKPRSIPIDLGLNPQDPWAVIPPERKTELQASLAKMAHIRRVAFDRSRHLPMP